MLPSLPSLTLKWPAPAGRGMRPVHTAAAVEGGSGSSVDAPLQERPRGDKGKDMSGQRREEKNRKGR